MTEKTTLKAFVLDEATMRDYGFTDHVEEHWYYCRTLRNNVSFNVTIDKLADAAGNYAFTVEVLDELFMQHYDYQHLLVKNPEFEPALKMKELVEAKMQEMQDLGFISGFVKDMYI